MTRSQDFSGLWKLSFTWVNSLEPQGGVSEYNVRIHKTGNQLVMQSVADSKKNYFVARLTFDPTINIMAGTWEEDAMPDGTYKGKVYYGVGMLKLNDSGNEMHGKIVEYNNDMEIIAGQWDVVRMEQTND